MAAAKLGFGSAMSNAPDANNPSDDSPLSNLRTCGGILIPELPSPGVPSLLVVLQSLGHMLNCVRIGKIAGVPRIIAVSYTHLTLPTKA